MTNFYFHATGYNQQDEFYKKVTDIIKAKIQSEEENNQWRYWNRKDFTGDDNREFSRGRPIFVLTRVATKYELMKLTKGKELNKKTYEQLIEGKTLNYDKKIDEEIKGCFSDNSDVLPMSKLDKLIGGEGENNDKLLTIHGLSRSSCGRFSKGETLRWYQIYLDGKRIHFDPNDFLRKLLGLERNNYKESITHQNHDIKILEKLKDDLKKQSENITKVSNILKSYLVGIEKQEINKISQKNLDELMERILNYDYTILFKILNTLVKDERLEDVENKLFKNAINELRNKFKISETDFNQWISDTLKPENLEPPQINPEKPRI